MQRHWVYYSLKIWAFTILSASVFFFADILLTADTFELFGLLNLIFYSALAFIPSYLLSLFVFLYIATKDWTQLTKKSILIITLSLLVAIPFYILNMTRMGPDSLTLICQETGLWLAIILIRIPAPETDFNFSDFQSVPQVQDSLS